MFAFAKMMARDVRVFKLLCMGKSYSVKAQNIQLSRQQDGQFAIFYEPNIHYFSAGSEQSNSPDSLINDDTTDQKLANITASHLRSLESDNLSKQFDFSELLKALSTQHAQETLNIVLVLSRAGAGKLYAQAVEGVSVAYDGHLGLVSITGSKQDVTAFMKTVYFHADVTDIADFYIDIRITRDPIKLQDVDDVSVLEQTFFGSNILLFAERMVMLYEQETGFYVAQMRAKSSGASQVADLEVVVTTPNDLVEIIPYDALQALRQSTFEGQAIAPAITAFAERIGNTYDDLAIVSTPPSASAPVIQPIFSDEPAITEPVPIVPRGEITLLSPRGARNTPPTAVDDAFNMVVAQTITIDAINLTDGLLDNDTDADDGDTLAISAIDALSANGGTITDNMDGTYDYTTPAFYVGTDSFTYMISDGTDTHSATVTITIADNVGLTPSLTDTLVDADDVGEFSGLAADWHASDTIIGGIDTDTLTLTAGTVNVTVDGANYSNIQEVENIVLQGDEAHSLSIDDSYFDRGTGLVNDRLTIDASASTTNNVTIDANTATAPHSLTVTTAAGDDTIKSGSGNDSITSVAGSDSIVSGAGNDSISASWNGTNIVNTPDAIAGGNLLLWLDGSDIDGDGTAEGAGEAGLSSGNVTQWIDKSGNSRDLDSVNGTPDYQTNHINGASVVHFNGSEYLQDADGESYLNGLNDVTAFYVVQADNLQDRGFFRTDTGTGDSGIGIRFDASGINGGGTPNVLKIADGRGKQIESSANTQTTNPLIIQHERSTGTQQNLYLNGVLDAPSHTQGNSTGALNGLDYVRVGDHGKGGWQGDVAEVILFNKVLSAAEQEAVEGYLQEKYAIATGTTLINEDDVIDGGAGNDHLALTGDVLNIELDGVTTDITSIESFDLSNNDNAHRIVMTDGYYNAGAGIENDVVTIDVNGNSNGSTIEAVSITGAHRIIYQGSDGADSVVSGAGNDSITGAAGHDTISAGDGNNTISGGADDDSITSGSGADSIVAGDGDDTVTSGAGNDTIQAGTGSDSIDAGAGDDVITVNAVPAAYSPLNISGLQIWLDADDLDGDGVAEGAGEAGLSGTLVDQWSDKSGNNNHAIAPTTGNRPTLNVVNRDVDFNNDILNVGNNGDFEDQEFTVIAVGHWDSSVNWGNTFASVYGESGNGWQLRQRGGTFGDVTFTVRGTSGIDDPNPPSITTNTDFLAIGGFSDALDQRGIWANGSNTYLNSNDTGDVNYNGNAPFAVGGRYTPGVSRTLRGGIKELIYFDKYLSDAERIALEGYLAHKWNIDGSLPAGHANKAAAPTSSIDDIINGGAGDDRLVITGNAQMLTLGAGNITDIEALDFTSNDNAHNITLSDGYFTGGTGIVDNQVHLDFTSITNGVTVNAASVSAPYSIDVKGGEGNDTVTAGDAASLIDGQGGDDSLNGGRGNDTLLGGAGNDTIMDSEGNNNIDGGDGDDLIQLVQAKGANGFIYDTNSGLGSLAAAKALLANPADATFTATKIDYDGGTVNAFLALGGDETSLSPAAFGTTNLDRIVFQITGFIRVDTAGTYNFRVSSDDGFELTIGGSVVTSFSGGRAFAPSTGAATLTAGKHAFELIYYENTGGEGLRFETDLTGSMQIVDDSLITGLTVPTHDTITGGAGNDTINAGAGNDTIDGGADQDSLTGGAGDDIFKFSALTDSNIALRDIITDFDQSGNDTINVNGIFGGVGNFIGVGVFNSTGINEIRAEQSGADTLIQLDMGGTGSIDMEFVMSNVLATSLVAGDFQL